MDLAPGTPDKNIVALSLLRGQKEWNSPTVEKEPGTKCVGTGANRCCPTILDHGKQNPVLILEDNNSTASSKPRPGSIQGILSRAK